MQLDGGSGTNTVSYDAAASAVSVSLRAGTASDGDGGTDTLSNIQNVTGSPNSGDTIEGDGGNNVLNGGGGANDAVSYANAPSGVNVDLGAGTASGDGSDTLSRLRRS